MYDRSHSREAYELPRRIELLYQRLLDLEAAPAFDPALAEILRLLADAVQCELVYVELSGRDGVDDYWLGHATFPLPPGALRSRISRELVHRALTERATVTADVPGAERRWREGAVAVSTPIGTDFPTGVLYVERIAPLAPPERERLESVARHLERVCPTMRAARQTLAARLRALKERCIREEMQRRERNIAEVARALGVSRMLVYRVVGATSRDTAGEKRLATRQHTPDMSRGET